MENPKVQTSIKIFSFIQESFRKGPIPWIFTVMAILLLFMAGWIVSLSRENKADRAQFRLDLQEAQRLKSECEKEKFNFAMEQVTEERKRGKKIDSLQVELKTLEK